jgi:hypothetical protein
MLCNRCEIQVNYKYEHFKMLPYSSAGLRDMQHLSTIDTEIFGTKIKSL